MSPGRSMTVPKINHLTCLEENSRVTLTMRMSLRATTAGARVSPPRTSSKHPERKITSFDVEED